MRRMRGFALITTVGLIALATIIALNYSHTIRQEIRISTFELDRLQAREAAESGIWTAVHKLLNTQAVEPWLTDSSLHYVSFNGIEIEVAVQDLTGLLDLNSASGANLDILLAYVLGDAARATRIRDLILDWRDTDHNTRPFGAEDRDYGAQGRDYGAKDGAFHVREELQLLLSLSLDEYSKIAPYVTVHGRSNSANMRVAPDRILKAMQISPTSKAARDATTLRPSAPERSNSLGRRFTRQRSVYEIFAKAKKGQVTSKVSATVEFRSTGRKNSLYTVIEWRESWPFELTGAAELTTNGF
ncbi:MAG: type II secretory pathway component PulK [Gammaproteobacteria bacterium]|jgi:type II secretory pathway component PulK